MVTGGIQFACSVVNGDGALINVAYSLNGYSDSGLPRESIYREYANKTTPVIIRMQSLHTFWCLGITTSFVKVNFF